MKKVSVIIPFHNTQKYLKRCLDSVVNQTYKELEILCINDSSTDDSLETVKEYSISDDRIKIINLQGKPIGAAAARNKAFEVMMGDYVGFVDSDDWIDLNYIEQMVENIEKSGAEIVMNRNIMEEYPDKSKKYIHPKDKLYPDNSFIEGRRAINDTFCSIWSKLYKKELFDKYKFRLGEGLPNDDFYFQYVTLIHIKELYVFSGAYYHYMFRDDSVTKTQKNVDLDHLKAYSRVYDYYKEHNLLGLGVKIFNILPNFSVNSQEKYAEYKKYFEKTKNYLFSNPELYNEMDLYFANNILNSKNFEEYSAKFHSSVVMSFLKRKKIAKE